MNERNSGIGQRWKSKSIDGGATWSPFEPIPDLPSISCNAGIITAQYQGKEILMYAGPVGPNAEVKDAKAEYPKKMKSHEKRQNGVVFVSFDGGETWPFRRLLVPDRFAYSSLVLLPDDNIGLFYETRNHLDIKLLKFSLDWLFLDNQKVEASNNMKIARFTLRPLVGRFFLMILLVLLGQTGYGQSGNERLNILLIISEDNSANLGCYGDPYARTPNLDKLASQGVRFDNAYVAQSVCSPSRGTIFTGLYPHQNGQIGLATHQYAMFRDWGTSYKYLKSAGYSTGLIGKTHVNPKEYVEDHVDMRYQENSNFGKKDLESYWKEAGKFIKEASAPFFLTVNYPDAHWPLQDQVEGMPENPQSVDEIGTLPFIGVESPDIMKSLTGYYNSMQRLDESVGKLIAELESSGKAENTVVIYMSDHGAQMARGKITPLEGGMKIPLIVRWPGVTKANTSTDALWSTIDLLPTLLEISGQQKPGYLPGRSVKPLLEKKQSASEYRQHLFTQRNCDGVIFYFPQRTVRDNQYKLIWSPIQDRANNAAELYLEHRHAHYFGSPTREELIDEPEEIQLAYKIWEFPPIYQLYDLKADPWEFKNLAEDVDYRDIRERLINTLQMWQVKTNDPLAEPFLLQELTREHDLLAGTEERSTAGGWKYLDYLHPDKREAISLETFKKFNSDQYTGIAYSTICKIGETPIANADDARYTGIREPNAVMTDKGTLVVVFGPHDQDARNDRAHQDLICRTSNDNGKTWSDARLIMDRGMESLLPTTLIYDKESSQLVLLVNQIFNAPERNDPLGLKEPNKHFVLFSKDEGRTWSEPKPILKMSREFVYSEEAMESSLYRDHMPAVFWSREGLVQMEPGRVYFIVMIMEKAGSSVRFVKKEIPRLAVVSWMMEPYYIAGGSRKTNLG